MTSMFKIKSLINSNTVSATRKKKRLRMLKKKKSKISKEKNYKLNKIDYLANLLSHPSFKLQNLRMCFFFQK